jgi:hypothetical protein
MMRADLLKKVKSYDNKDIMNKLSDYGVEKGEYDVKMDVYHSEDRRGVPYLTLVVKKNMPKAMQMDLQMDLLKIDPGLCVVFTR